MIDELYNNNDHRFVNGYDVYKEMLSDEEKRKQIFERLAYTSVTQNQDNKKCGTSYYRHVPKKKKAIFLNN